MKITYHPTASEDFVLSNKHGRQEQQVSLCLFILWHSHTSNSFCQKILLTFHSTAQSQASFFYGIVTSWQFCDKIIFIEHSVAYRDVRRHNHVSGSFYGTTHWQLNYLATVKYHFITHIDAARSLPDLSDIITLFFEVVRLKHGGGISTTPIVDYVAKINECLFCGANPVCRLLMFWCWTWWLRQEGLCGRPCRPDLMVQTVSVIHCVVYIALILILQM